MLVLMLGVLAVFHGMQFSSVITSKVVAHRLPRPHGM